MTDSAEVRIDGPEEAGQSVPGTEGAAPAEGAEPAGQAEAEIAEEKAFEAEAEAESSEDGAGEPSPEDSGEGAKDAAGSGEASPAQGAAKADDEDLQTRFLRLSADFQNYRRRTENEKKDIYAYANEKIVARLLDVLDSFDRALQAGSEDAKFLEGMQMIRKQFLDALTASGLEEIEAEGKPFDPNFHNAVMTEASDAGSGTVTRVFQKGYKLNGKVVRPSMVAVAQ